MMARGAHRGDAEPSGGGVLVRAYERTRAFLGWGGFVVAACVLLLVGVAIVLAVMVWVSYLPPDTPYREHY
jgi:hypothetical protein